MEKQKNKAVIIVAGGSGQRMGTEIPKQFLLIAGKPLLMHTIRRFYDFDPGLFIVVALPFEYIEMWNRLCSEHRFLIAHQVVAGGEERFFSVKNGLTLISDNYLVAIHDGVRPLVSNEIIEKSYAYAELYGGAIPAISPSESIRKIDGAGSTPHNRSDYRLVQTPQTFRADLIKKAYNKPFEPRFTDDATVFEAAGHTVHLFEGTVENIKITRPFDLRLAELYLSTQG
jgi:2-C-methyl-D-erythritol 4-phosphate cytidylyltransferase